MNETVNDRIKKIVDELFNGNANKFAKAINSPQSTINTIINGRRSGDNVVFTKPSYDIITSIVSAYELNIAAGWLLTGDGGMFNRDHPAMKPENVLCEKCAEKEIRISELKYTIGVQKELIIELKK